MSTNQLIERAVTAVGGSQSELARRIGCSAVFVHQMLHGKRTVSPRLCLPIEQATDGAVSRHELRPDIFGAAPIAGVTENAAIPAARPAGPPAAMPSAAA